MATTLTALALYLFMAALVEVSVEYFIAQPLKKAGIDTWFLMYVSLVTAFLLAWAFDASIPRTLGIACNVWVGYGATAFLTSRGSNWLSDFVGKYLKKM